MAEPVTLDAAALLADNVLTCAGATATAMRAPVVKSSEKLCRIAGLGENNGTNA